MITNNANKIVRQVGGMLNAQEKVAGADMPAVHESFHLPMLRNVIDSLRAGHFGSLVAHMKEAKP